MIQKYDIKSPILLCFFLRELQKYAYSSFLSYFVCFNSAVLVPAGTVGRGRIIQQLQPDGVTTALEQGGLIYTRTFTPFTLLQKPRHMVNICVSRRGNLYRPCFQFTTPSTESPPRICHLFSFRR